MKTKYTFVLNNNSKIVLTEEGGPKLSSDDIDKIMNSENIIVVSTATDSLKIRPSQISAIHVTTADGNNKKNSTQNEEHLYHNEHDAENDATTDAFYDIKDDSSDLYEDDIIVENDDVSNDNIELVSNIEFDDNDDLDSILTMSHEEDLDESTT
jgi:hypothetical protein